jgi:hypothetical protein
MPVRAVTVRFSEVMHDLVRREAEREEISIAQFCRESAIARVFFQSGKRGDLREADRLRVLRDAFQQLGVDPEHGLDVVVGLFNALGHSDDEPDEDEEPEPAPA